MQITLPEHNSMDVDMSNSQLISQSPLSAETDCSSVPSSSNFHETQTLRTSSSPTPFEEVFLPHQIVIKLERVNLDLVPEDEMTIKQETNTNSEVSPISFDDIFLPDQIVIKLERTDFGIETDNDIMPPPDILERTNFGIETDNDIMLPPKILERTNFGIETDNDIMPPPEILERTNFGIETDNDIMPPPEILMKIENSEVKESKEVAVFSNEDHHLLKEGIPIKCEALNSHSDSSIRPTHVAMEEPILGCTQVRNTRYGCPIWYPPIWPNATDLDTHMAKTHKMSKLTEPPLPALSFNLLNDQSFTSNVVTDILCPAENQSINTPLSDNVRSGTASNLEPTIKPSLGSSVPSSNGTDSSRKLSTCTICRMQQTCTAEHILDHIQTANRPHPCPICPRTWFSATDLSAHLTRVHQMPLSAQPQIFDPVHDVQKPPSAQPQRFDSVHDVQMPPSAQPQTFDSVHDVQMPPSAQPQTFDSVHDVQSPLQSLGNGRKKKTSFRTMTPSTPNLVETEMKSVACPFCLNSPKWFTNTFDLRAHLTETHATELEVARSSNSESSSSNSSFDNVPTQVRPGSRPESGVPIITDDQCQGTSAGSFDQTIDEVLGELKSSTPTTNSNKMMQCTICKQFPTNMMLHWLSHKQSKQLSLPCPICPQVWFSKKETLSAHMHRVHNQPLPPQLFMTDHEVEDTLVNLGMPPNQRGHDKKKSVCVICGMQVSGMKVHMLRHTQSDGRRLPCPICPRTWFSNNVSLITHMSRVHPTMSTHSEMSTSNAFTMPPASLHIKDEIPFTFDTGGDTSESNQTRGDELEHFAPSTSNSAQKVPSTCTICETQSTSMAEHMLIHTQSADRPFPCKICPRTWFSAADLCIHWTEVHRIASVSSNLTSEKSSFATSRDHKVTSEQETATIRGGQSSVYETQNPQSAAGASINTPQTSTGFYILQCPICQSPTTDLLDHLHKHSQTEFQLVACPCCSNPPAWFANAFDLRVHLTQSHENILSGQSTQSTSSSATTTPVSAEAVFVVTDSNREPSPIINLQSQSISTTTCSIQDTIDEVVHKNNWNRSHTMMADTPNKNRTFDKSKCTICGYSYSHFESHMRRHTKAWNRSQPCPICPQTWFSHKHLLRLHIAAIHGTEQQPECNKPPVADTVKEQPLAMKCETITEETDLYANMTSYQLA